MEKFILVFLTVTFLVAASLSGLESDLQADRVYNLDSFYSQLDDYFKSFYSKEYAGQYDPRDIRGRFSLARGGRENLYASADMVYLLFTLGELDARTTAEGRREWAAIIQSCQDPETGWFTRKRGMDRITTSPFKEHSTAYAVSALIMLGEKPLYPLTDALKITRSEKSTRLWLESNLWIYVWSGSHQGGGMGAAMEMTGEAPEEWFGWYFDWLDKEVNPETGLWQRAPWNAFYKKPLLEEMGGAPHFWWVYYHKGRPLPYPEEIIDTCLALQLPSGLWSRKDYTYCLDLDALWSIHRAYLQLKKQGIEYRTDDIRDSFERYIAAACGILNQPDSLERLYKKAHTLPGAMIALAEAQKFFHETLGEKKLETPKPLKQVLDFISWI